MGVRGLTTYINFNESSFLKTYFLHDSCLVIDGHSLCAQLYRRLKCFSAFGGDYDKFAAYVRTFFKNLKKCNITSYVIFDGSYEQRKLKTAYHRLRSKINGASRLDPVTQGSLQIFPLLMRDVFIEALMDMAIPYTVCEFEADDEIAAMARFLSCPVLSYDSDFFIYNVQYIPIDNLQMKPKQITDDGKVIALECKLYQVEYMTTHFGGLNEELLPLLATLLGNDYVEKRVFNKFFEELKIPKSKKKKNDQQKCIHGLFKWLQNETLESAMSKIIGRLKKKEKDRVLFIMKKSIEGYKRRDCRSLKYFNLSREVTVVETEMTFDFEIASKDDLGIQRQETSDIESSSSDEESNSDGEDSNDEEQIQQRHVGVSDWYAEKLRCNRIPKPYLNLFTHHLYFSSPQAEDYADDDCFLSCFPILRYSFDILTDFSEDSMTYVGREKDLSYKRINVDRHYSLPRPLNIPFSEISEDQLNTYFFYFLQQKMELLDMSLIELLPANFQLVMIAILWWVATCSVPIGHVHSVLLSYIMLEVIDEKTGTFRGQYFFNNKYAKKLLEIKTRSKAYKEEQVTELLNKNKVQYEDCMIAASTLLKHFELDDKISKKPKTYDTKKMQSFAQFQCCLMQINSLNTLCSCPFQSTKYCKTFNGTFVYNISKLLENQSDPCKFVNDYLKGAVTVLIFYKSISKNFDECVEKMKIATVKWSASGKKRRRKKNDELDEINFIVKGFESEVII